MPEQDSGSVVFKVGIFISKHTLAWVLEKTPFDHLTFIFNFAVSKIRSLLPFFSAEAPTTGGLVVQGGKAALC